MRRRWRRLPKSGRARDVEERDGADAAEGGQRCGGGAHPGRRQRRRPRGRGGGTLVVPVTAGRVADAVVTGATWPGRRPAVVVVDAASGGVNNADVDADARPRVTRVVRITESEGVSASGGVSASVGVTSSVGVTTSVGVAGSVGVAASAAVVATVAAATATAVTNAPAATRADATAVARDATSSSGPDAESGDAAAGFVAREWRGVQGRIRGRHPGVVVAANGVGTPAEAAGDRGGVRADGRRNGGAAIGRRTARPDAGRSRRRASVDGAGKRVAAERGGHAGETPAGV